MTTITQRPHTFSFSENEIAYLFNVSDPATAGAAVEVELYYTLANGTGDTLLTSFILYPTAAGDVYCGVAAYLKSLLQPELPVMGGAMIQPVTTQVAYFYIRFREITTAAPAPAWITDKPKLLTVLLGGVEQAVFKQNNFFTSYFPLNKPFLTWQPAGRFIFANESHYLTFLNITGSAFNVQVVTTFTDGTDDVRTTASSTVAGLLWRLKSGAEDLGLHLIAPAKQIHYYEISVLNTATGNTLVNTYRFYIEYRPVYTAYDLFFFNSIGGFDEVRVNGETAISIEMSVDEIEHVTGNDAKGTDRPQSQYSQANALKKDNYKGDVGWLRTPDQQNSLADLMMAGDRRRGIYEIVDGRWIKVLNLKKNLDLRTTTDKKWSFPVEWSRAYSDPVFTPKNINLGNANGVIGQIGGLILTTQIIGGIMWYHTSWTNVTGVPDNMMVEVSTDGVTWTPAPLMNFIDATHCDYSLNAGSGASHYMRITPLYFSVPGATINYYFSTEYGLDFTATSITNNSFYITTGFSSSVTWDLSLDNGATYIQSGLASSNYHVTGLTSATTYLVVRRMHSAAGPAQVLTAQSVTTL